MVGNIRGKKTLTRVSRSARRSPCPKFVVNHPPFFYISRMVRPLLCLLIVCLASSAVAQPRSESAFRIARVKYSGGGDWYNDPSAEVNLLRFVSENTTIETDPHYRFVDLSGSEVFSYPFLFLTGHGNVVFSDAEAGQLREYLVRGGFLFVDDDYGLDRAFRREMKKVFPEEEFVELPFSHGIYRSHFSFPGGLPKTHEHDDRPPQGFGLFHRGRLVVFYSYESNISDGWADPEVHKDPPAVRLEALRFGTNLVVWSLMN